MENIKGLINKMVDKKINHLAHWQNVQYYGGRLFYETDLIEQALAEFNPEIQMYYLERLAEQIKTRKIIIRDNGPHSAPDITGKFLDWLESVLVKMQILNYSGNTKKETPEPEPEPPETVKNNSVHDFPEIFAKNGFKTFIMLDEKYIRDNKFLKTKYSNIYRVMQEKFIIGTQDQFINFLTERYNVTPSKLLNNDYKESDKFKKRIKPRLLNLMEQFKDEN